MSNVLIGIIGVILFIGLALAGALILGDDFRTAGSTSQSAAVMSQLKQVSDAVDMYKVKTGNSTVYSVDTSFLTPRFLKVAATNPSKAARTNTGYPYTAQLNARVWPETNAQPTVVSRYAQMGVGPNGDSQAASLCQAINDTYGISGIPTIPDSASLPANRTGCVLANGTYSAYVTL